MKNYYNQDPRWIKARFNSNCHKCQEQIEKGDDILYYPKGKTVYCETCGMPEWKTFQAEVSMDSYGNDLYYVS